MKQAGRFRLFIGLCLLALLGLSAGLFILSYQQKQARVRDAQAAKAAAYEDLVEQLDFDTWKILKGLPAGLTKSDLTRAELAAFEEYLSTRDRLVKLRTRVQEAHPDWDSARVSAEIHGFTDEEEQWLRDGLEKANGKQ